MNLALKINRPLAGPMSYLSSPSTPLGETCKGCGGKVHQGHEVFYHVGFFYWRPYCVHCAVKFELISMVQVQTEAFEPRSEAAASHRRDEEIKRAIRNDAVRVLVQMGVSRSDALRKVWEVMTDQPELESADQVITAVIAARNR